MSCNGCRVLRKGCSESCVLRQCLRMIESPEAQGHATLFVAKFFGRAGLMSFVSAVPEPQRPALFQSLLFEACGRTINPVNGAVGLLWSGNWHLCQAAVETVLRGGTLRPLPQDEEPQVDCFFEAAGSFCEPSVRMLCSRQQQESLKRPRMSSPMCEADNEGRRVTGGARPSAPSNLELRLSGEVDDRRQQKRPGTPSEESGTTCAESGDWATAACQQQQEQVPLLLNLFA